MAKGNWHRSPWMLRFCELLGAQAARFHVADYSPRTLEHIGAGGPHGTPQRIAGTMIGRVFKSIETQIDRVSARGGQMRSASENSTRRSSSDSRRRLNYDISNVQASLATAVHRPDLSTH